MKARPRYVERKVALYLTDNLFAPLGFDPVERVPVIGRTGPDLAVNGSGLAIDVKSRLEVPAGLWEIQKGQITRIGGRMLGLYLKDIRLLAGDLTISEDQIRSYKTIDGYLDHMAGWCSEWHIPALVLHRPMRHPEMKIANAVFVMYKNDFGRLNARLSKKEKLCHEELLNRQPR